MKNTIIIIVLVSIGLLGLMWWGAQNTTTVSSSPPEQSETVSALVASEKLYDFGTISMAKGNVTHTFAVTNPTDKDILVNNLTTSCMCTAAYIVEGNSKIGPFGMPGMGFAPKANMLIKAGETRNIDVVYDPNAHGPAGVGPVDRLVYLVDTNGGTLELEIKAVVTP
ncbi:MAG: DUF1573 domain-containing protein [Candidatus Liptonbacteria bacterium]|nr:DUF1573 domain-containing protein [Candidatus Liptonbacteria bacterium]